MKLLIPEIGTKLKLIEDWTFLLQSEYRNEKLFKKLELDMNKSKTRIVTIPKDTIMTVDRIYIKKGSNSYSSLTFNIPKKENKKHPLGGSRFWASLTDVNQIEFEQLECNEETLEMIQILNNELRDKHNNHIISEFFSKALGGRNVNNVRPDYTPFILLNKCRKVAKEQFVNYNNGFSSSHNKYYIEAYDDIVKLVELKFRKFKIDMLINDDEDK